MANFKVTDGAPLPLSPTPAPASAVVGLPRSNRGVAWVASTPSGRTALAPAVSTVRAAFAAGSAPTARVVPTAVAVAVAVAAAVTDGCFFGGAVAPSLLLVLSRPAAKAAVAKKKRKDGRGNWR